MNIGELDRRIVIESPERSRDEYGEELLTWSTYRTVWAKVDWNGGNEKEELQRITAMAKVIFFIRNLDIAITKNLRILYQSKYYYVKVVNEIEGREAFLEIETEQRD